MRRFNSRLRRLMRWVLGIHTPSDHRNEVCWCAGTKREIKNPPHFWTNSQAMAEMLAFAKYFDEISKTKEEPKK